MTRHSEFVPLEASRGKARRSRWSLAEMGEMEIIRSGDESRFVCRERMAFGDEPHKWSVWRAVPGTTEVELVADGLAKDAALELARTA